MFPYLLCSTSFSGFSSSTLPCQYLKHRIKLINYCRTTATTSLLSATVTNAVIGRKIKLQIKENNATQNYGLCKETNPIVNVQHCSSNWQSTQAIQLKENDTNCFVHCPVLNTHNVIVFWETTVGTVFCLVCFPAICHTYV